MIGLAARSWRALGTSAHVLVTDAAALELADAAVRDVLDDVDAACSRFRPDSELSRLNARAGADVVASPLLATAIGASLRAAYLTGGAVDPTVGRALRLAGYDRDFEWIRGQIDGTAGMPAPTVEAVPGWLAVRFDPDARVVRTPARVEIDLGSVGKALAADLAAAAAFEATGAGVVVSLGGDIATAGDPPAAGWQVLVAESHAASPDGDGQVIALHGGAVATSGTTERRWSRAGTIRHHLIDPATGLPAGGPWRTATVVAATCVDANAAATAAIVKGERALAWLEDVGLPARLVAGNGDVQYAGDWPAPAGVEMA